MPISAMTVGLIHSTLSDCGVALPKSAQEAFDALTAIQDEASRDVVAEAMQDAGTLTAKTAAKQVQRLATALVAKDRAVEAAQHFERPVLQQFRDAIAGHVEDLIVALRVPFDAAAEVVQTAAILVDPDMPPSTGASLDVLDAYQRLEDAERRLNAVRQARIRVFEMVGYAEPDASWFIESVTDEENLRLARVHYKRGWHRLVRAGYKLRLNTTTEAAALVASATQTTAADYKAETQRRIEANRDPLRNRVFEEVLGQ